MPSVSKAKQGVASEDKQLMAMMEQNNAILAELSASIRQLRKPTIEPKVRFALQNDTNQTSVAALARPHEKSDIQELKELLLIVTLMPAYEGWLEETKASVRKHLARGPEVVNHYVLLMVDAHISKQVALIVEITRQEVLCHNKISPTE